MDENIRDSDELIQWLFDDAMFDDAEELDVDDFDLDAESPKYCTLREAFEYVEWANEAHNNEEVAEAALELGIAANDIDQCYQGSYRSEADFAEQLTTDTCDIDVPSWVVIDWQATWDYALTYDYVQHGGHYFQNI